MIFDGGIKTNSGGPSNTQVAHYQVHFGGSVKVHIDSYEHGEVFKTYYIYPEGEIFIDVKLRMPKSFLHSHLSDAYLKLNLPSYDKISFGKEPLVESALLHNESIHKERITDLVNNYLFFTKPSFPSAGVYWGDNLKKGNYVVKILSQKDEETLFLNWQENNPIAISKNEEYQVSFCLSLGRSFNNLEKHAYLHNHPFNIKMIKGEYKGYNQKAGIYEIIKDKKDNSALFSFEGSEKIRIKVEGLGYGGGVKITDNKGRSYSSQLICSKGSVANKAIFSARPATVRLEETNGFQLVYLESKEFRWPIFFLRKQPNVNVVLAKIDLCGPPHGNSKSYPPGPCLGPIYRLNSYKPVLRRFFLHWGKDIYAGWKISKNFSLNCFFPEEFRIVENKPELISFYFKSRNSLNTAISEAWIRIPERNDILGMDIKEKFTSTTGEYNTFRERELECFNPDPAQPCQRVYEFTFFSNKLANNSIDFRQTRRDHDKALFAQENGIAGWISNKDGNIFILHREFQLGKRDFSMAICNMGADLHYAVIHPEASRTNPYILPAGKSYTMGWSLYLFGDESDTIEYIKTLDCSPNNGDNLDFKADEKRLILIRTNEIDIIAKKSTEEKIKMALSDQYLHKLVVDLERNIIENKYLTGRTTGEKEIMLNILADRTVILERQNFPSVLEISGDNVYLKEINGKKFKLKGKGKCVFTIKNPYSKLDIQLLKNGNEYKKCKVKRDNITITTILNGETFFEIK